MSADLWLVIDTGGAEPAQVGADHSITYNLSDMLRAAGYPGHKEMVGRGAVEAGLILCDVAAELRSDPVRFRLMNPENGWGNYEGAIEWCERLAADCNKHPKAHIAAGL